MKATPLSAALLALSLLGCPEPGVGCPDGGPCDAGCGAQGCDAGECREVSPLGTPPNLLANPGFECGERFWTASFIGGGVLSIESSGARSGAKAARLSAPSAAAAVTLDSDTRVPSPGQGTYCARAWMKGTAANARLRVRRDLGGGVFEDTYSSPITADWVTVPPLTYGAMKVPTESGDLALLFSVYIPDARAGDYLVVDDAQLWRSADGSCSER